MVNANRFVGRQKGSNCGDFKGRILKVKQGYNPNSSSLGSIVFSLPVMLVSISTLFGFTASILFAAIDQPHNRKDFETKNGETDTGQDKPDREGESP